MNKRFLKKLLPKRLNAQIKLARYLTWYLPSSRNYWLNDAKQKIELIDDLMTEQKNRLYQDYCRDYDKYRVKFSEYYYGYHFPNLSEKQKKQFLSMRDFESILKKYGYLYPHQGQITGKKELFLNAYSDFINRRWMLIDEETPVEEIQCFLDSLDVIVKPTDSCGGDGVKKLKKGQENASAIKNEKLPILMEECVQNIDVLAEFHPASLNTIRVTTLTNGVKVKILGAFFRTGNNGSVYDNADAGGVFAEIDPSTGILISDGVTEKGVVYETHPVSGKRFRGFQIPNWNDVLQTCNRAARHMKQSFMIAWDIAVTPDGIEIIEGNSIPSIEPHQIPLQSGIRKKLYRQMKELRLGYNDAVFLTKLIGAIRK